MSTRSIGFSIYLDGQLVREETFDTPVITVGKLSTCTLRVDDLNVSRKHAVIERLEDGRWRVTDLGSTNGTVIREERVTQAFLKDGDRIVLGTTTLLVKLETGAARPAEAAAPRPAPAPKPAGPAIELGSLGSQSFLKKGDEPAAGSAADVLDVALLWGDTILKAQTWTAPATVTLGPDGDFVVPEEVTAGLTLVEPASGRFALTRQALAANGDLLRDGKVRSLAEAASEAGGAGLTLDRPTRARLKFGEFSVLISWGPGMPLVLPSSMKNADKEPALFLLASAVLHLAFLFISMSIPEDMLVATRDPRIERQKFMQMVRTELKPEEKEKKQEAKKDDKLKDKRKVDPDADKRLEVTQPETTVNDNPNPNPSRIVDRLSETRVNNEELKKLTPEQRAEMAKQRAQQTAAAATLRSSSLMTQLMASSNMNQKVAFRTLGSYDPSNTASFADGALDPFSGTLSQGASGALVAEGGPGGVGGPGGPGGPAVAGIGGPRGGGLDDLNFNERPLEPKIIESAPQLSGELDAKTVQQYIRRQLAGVKACYQERLQQDRSLAGKVTLAFTILPNGGVTNVATRNSTLGDGDLEGCIRNKMSRWKFPSPKDGGVVEVAYPLILKSQ